MSLGRVNSRFLEAKMSFFTIRGHDRAKKANNTPRAQSRDAQILELIER